ncbi:MAG: SDR family NAD(P)-dependent oxidoreductase [Rickettsiales bacterium]|nr:SDR family NAD(P)-dependent oxidoreductase [Rickettsiales bacterium]
MKSPKNILITGASSGIGKALAIKYATHSDVNLFLSGRNLERLEEVKKICQELKRGANVFCKIIDVRDESDMANWIDEIEKNYELDLVIANAGISAGTASGVESSKQIKEIFAINLDGALNTINPAIAKMRQRKKGQIAIISSLAGFRGLPSSPAYSASKAAVRVYGEALRGNLREFGIAVNVVCPGYIKTPMTDVNNFPMPFLMPPEKCAEVIVKKLKKNVSRISFPFPLFFVVWFTTLLSNKITDPIFAKLPKKKAME